LARKLAPACFSFAAIGAVIIRSRSTGSLARMLAALRLACVVFHVAVGFAVVLPFPLLGLAVREALLRWWARGLLSALDVRLKVTGVRSSLPGLIVANHISWLDVIALAAVRPAVFVCKAEIADWPGIGWLLRRAGMIFIRRGSFRDVWRVNLRLRACFMASRSVAAFPEGTTTEGRDVLAFRPALFQPAVECELPVHPVAIAYSSADAAFLGETTFLASLLVVAAARNLEVHLALLRPLDTRGATRGAIASRARNLILARMLGLRLDAEPRAAAPRVSGVAPAPR
jgi:1-acyl-sn-glycerol-3-phosphate acyltransferase